MINLVDELQKAYNGDAWHGSNTLSLLEIANAEKVFTHPIPNAHSIAELVLHLISWTEEVLDRINGETAKEPTRGDWPMPTEMSETGWDEILNQFRSANQKLIKALDKFESLSWSNEVKDERIPSLGSGVNNAKLINGLIQHHAYHSGQIALLLKF
ncbi:MAG: DinB family protein [Pedobacter sp.]|nr:MAG: DinB family protein [Pedobacter sp.]